MNTNQAELEKHFKERLVTLHNGASGLRGGLHCDVKEVAGELPILDFIASDETLDRYEEVVKVDGWQLENFRKNPVVPDCHDYSSIAKILGRSPSVEIKDGKLINRVEFCLENPLGNLAYKMARGGFIKSESVGFIPMEYKYGIGNDEPYRTFLKQELLEISLVVVPANPGATIGAAMKSGALEKADVTNVVELLKQFCSEEADPESNAGATSAGIQGARLLQLARDFNAVLKRA